MSASLLYRPAKKWPFMVALASAVLIHLGAVALAALRPQPVTAVVTAPEEAGLIEVDTPESIPPEDPADAPVTPAPVLTEENLAEDVQVIPPPVKKRSPLPIPRRPKDTGSTASVGPAKLLAISAPRPEYPYEARRAHLTGSGIAALTVDSRTGVVLNVTMTQSTGSSILDNATVSGLRRWRFRPGTVSKVVTPITYTLTGASY